MSRLLALGVAVLMVSSACADEIILKNGGRFHGRILREDDRSITLQLSYGNMTFSRTEIEEVLRDSPQARVREELMLRLDRGHYGHALHSASELAALSPENEREGELARWLVLIADHQLDEWKLSGAAETLGVARHASAAAPGLVASETRLAELEALATLRLGEARLRLQRNSANFDPERVEATLARMLEIDTAIGKDLRRTYALALAYRASRMLPEGGESAVPLLERSLEIAPDVGEGVVQAYILARAVAAYRTFERGDAHAAEGHVEAALSIDPASRVAHFVRGQLRHAQGEIRAATDDYLRALAREDSRLVASTEVAEDLRDECMMWVRENFRLEDVLTGGLGSSFSTDAPMFDASDEDILVRSPDSGLSSLLVEQLHEQRKQLVSTLKLPAPILAFDVPLHVVIHPTVGQFRATVPSSGEFAALTVFASDASGMLASHTIHTYADVPDLRTSVMPHELAHVLVAGTIGYQLSLPLWLHEGLAISAEPSFHRASRMKQVKEAAATGDLIPLDQIVGSAGYPSSSYDVQLFYAQSFTLVTFLRERMSLARFWRFARHMGKSVEAGLEVLLETEESLDDLELDWLVWLGVMER